MFRIVSPWLLLLYCSTSTLCSLCQTLPRPVRFFALCPSCSGRPPLSLLLGRWIRSLAPGFLPLRSPLIRLSLLTRILPESYSRLRFCVSYIGTISSVYTWSILTPISTCLLTHSSSTINDF